MISDHQSTQYWMYCAPVFCTRIQNAQRCTDEHTRDPLVKTRRTCILSSQLLRKFNWLHGIHPEATIDRGALQESTYYTLERSQRQEPPFPSRFSIHVPIRSGPGSTYCKPRHCIPQRGGKRGLESVHKMGSGSLAPRCQSQCAKRSRLDQLNADLPEPFAEVVQAALEEAAVLLPPEFLLVPFGRLSPLPADRWPLVVSEDPRGRLWRKSHRRR